MIPLKDLTPRRSFPVITLLLIVANFLVFFYQLSLPPKMADALVMTYGLVPVRIQYALAGTHHVTLAQAFIPLFTCMFLHGGWMHIIGNMWFLWIFGGNVEDRFGALPYLLFYIVCGLGSGISQVLFSWGSKIPSIGASGAISGVLGAIRGVFPGLADTHACTAFHHLLHGTYPRGDIHRTLVHCAILERAWIAGCREHGRRCVVGARGGIRDWIGDRTGCKVRHTRDRLRLSNDPGRVEELSDLSDSW